MHTKSVTQIRMACILVVWQQQRFKRNREVQHRVGGIPICTARKEVADPLASYASKKPVQCKVHWRPWLHDPVSSKHLSRGDRCGKILCSQDRTPSGNAWHSKNQLLPDR
jgi:hypothetical protein